VDDQEWQAWQARAETLGEPLTEVEKQVLKLFLFEGKPQEEIADSAQLSFEAVGEVIYEVFDRLGRAVMPLSDPDPSPDPPTAAAAALAVPIPMDIPKHVGRTVPHKPRKQG
jgi:hypothetical protein